jgi:hypothetical protein
VRVRIDWTRELASPPLGLCLAREPGLALVFDAERTLTLIDPAGQVALKRPSPATLAAAAFSDEGKVVAAVGRRGQVWLLNAEFDVIWQRGLTPRPIAAAIDHLGLAVAVADEAGGLTVFDARGQEMWKAATARPLVHLAYAPESGALVGAADLGLVCAFDRAGKELWREGLMANVGSLAVSGTGERIVLACFSEGLRCCSLEKPRPHKLAGTRECRHAAVSYGGDVILSAGADPRLTVCDASGATRGELALPATPSALALAALAERAVAACDRAVVGIDLERRLPSGSSAR